MIGLGKWGCHVDTMFFSGDVELTVKDNNGEYDFDENFTKEKELEKETAVSNALKHWHTFLVRARKK